MQNFTTDAPSTFWETYLPNSIKSHLPGGGEGGGGGGGRSNSAGATQLHFSYFLTCFTLLLVAIISTVTNNLQLTIGRSSWLSLVCQTWSTVFFVTLLYCYFKLCNMKNKLFSSCQSYRKQLNQSFKACFFVFFLFLVHFPPPPSHSAFNNNTL